MRRIDSHNLFRTVIHPTLSILLSLFFVAILSSVIEILVDIPRTGSGFTLYLFCIGISETVLGNILFSEHAQRGNRLREFLIVLIFSYIVFSLPQSGPFIQRFYPNIIIIYRVLLVTAMWLITYSLHERFRVWELYLKLRANKSGDELKQYIRDSMVFIADVKKQLTMLKRNISIMLAVLVVGITILYIWNKTLPASDVAAVGGFLLLYFVTMGMANSFIEEFYISGEGLRIPNRYTFRRLLSALLIICVILFFGFLVASDNALLPVSLLERFFAWLSSLFQTESVNLKPPEPVQPFQYEGMERMEQPMTMKNVKTYLFFEKLFAILKKAALVAAITLAAIFIFGPLFSENFRDYLKRLRLFRVLGRTLKRFLGFFREMLIMLIDIIKKRQTIGEILESFSGRSRKKRRAEKTGRDYSWMKRRELDHLTKQLVRIFRWAKKRGHPYFTTRTLQEYFDVLSKDENIPSDHLENVRTIYEEARFSPVMLGRGKRRQFMESVKIILAE